MNDDKEEQGGMVAENRVLTTGQVIYLIFNTLLYPALLLLSGDWTWVEGWFFSIWSWFHS